MIGSRWQLVEDSVPDTLLDAGEFGRLRWRCRRGMLENDLFLERFLYRYESTLTVRQARCLTDLMDLNDNDLLDLHLGRRTLYQVNAALDRDDIVEVLGMLRENR